MYDHTTHLSDHYYMIIICNTHLHNEWNLCYNFVTKKSRGCLKRS